MQLVIGLLTHFTQPTRRQKLLNFFKQNWTQFLFWAVLLFILVTNTLHETFPDEYDNILGGWFMLQGKALYSEFFTHHNPLAYWVSALITLFTRQSFVGFRLGLALFWWLGALFSWRLIAKRLSSSWARLYQATILLWAVVAIYFWMHMMLADSLASFIVIPVSILATGWITLKKHRQPRLMMLTIHLGTFLLFLASQSYLYLIIVLNGLSWLVFLQRTQLSNWISRRSILLATWVLVPYVLFIGWYAVRGNLGHYIRHTYEFNAKYYIYNYPKEVGDPHINPVRYALITANKVVYDYVDLMMMIPSMPLHKPMNIAAMLVVVSLLALAVARKKPGLFLLVGTAIVMASFRAAPLDSKLQDFQSAVYWSLVLWFGVYWFVMVRRYLNRHSLVFGQIVMGSLVLLTGLFSAASLAQFGFYWQEQLFGKYMGELPLIYDRPIQAPLLNAVVPQGEKVWVGPFHFEDQFYLDREAGSAYTILLPEFKYDSRIQTEILEDIAQNRPYIISMDTDFSVRGGVPYNDARFFLDYLPQEYTKLEWVEREGKQLRSQLDTSKVDMPADWWIRTDKVDEAVDRMLELGYVKFE